MKCDDTVKQAATIYSAATGVLGGLFMPVILSLGDGWASARFWRSALGVCRQNFSSLHSRKCSMAGSYIYL